MDWHRMDDPQNPPPKDGTWILLAGGDAGDSDNLYMSDSSIPAEQARIIAARQAIDTRPVVAKWIEDDGFWAYAAWDSDWRSEYTSPTYWARIEPPKE